MNEIEKVILGRKATVEGLVVGMVRKGYVLVEGLLGLAKTLAVETRWATIRAWI